LLPIITKSYLFPSYRSALRGNALLLAATCLVDSRWRLLVIVIVIILVATVLAGRDPQTALTVLEWLVLVGEVDGLAGVTICAALRKRACACGELGADSCVLLNPVGERILAILDDGFAGLVAIVCLASLAWSDRGLVNELEEVFAEASDDGELLAVLAESVELVVEGCLQLLTGDVAELSLGYERLGFGADKLLLEHNNLWAVWLLVLELGNLISNLLLA
jgi:hypothetical protein